MKSIPDFDIELIQSINYIFNSILAKKAFINPPFKNYINILTEILENIDRLADNCHMPEFTNHAMPHICSIVKRASEWAESDGWIDYISSQEAGYLLMALLIHDIGMLSQDSRDIPDSEEIRYIKGLSDISNWVRRTHVIRIDGLVKFLLKDLYDEELLVHLNVIIGMAQSHAKWPWETDFVSRKNDIAKVNLKEERIAAFNAVIAVCDLLDEDSNRCDTLTLIKHHHGTIENRAHWIRHALTKEVIGVKNHKVIIEFRRLIPESDNLDIVYKTLRNHYRLIKLYNENLTVIKAEIEYLEFHPSSGLPSTKDKISEELSIYSKIEEFKYNLTPQLMATFMKEALNQDRSNTTLCQRLDKIELEVIDISPMEEFFNLRTLLYPEEHVIWGAGLLSEKLNYAYKLAEEAYANGDIGKLRHICMVVLKIIKSQNVSLDQVYWALVYSIIYEIKDTDFYTVKISYKKYIKYSESPYQGLIDILFYLIEPLISIPKKELEEYKEHLFQYDYSKLRHDFATILLIQTIIGLFWFWDAESELWCKVSNYMQQNIIIDTLLEILKKQQKRLKIQYKILHGIEDVSEQELMDTEQPILAKSWKDFYQADWGKVSDDIPQMLHHAENNSDLFCSIQGFQNMTRTIIKLNSSNTDIKSNNDYYVDIYRYQRKTDEQGLSRFWQNRKNYITTLLTKIRISSTNTASERISSIRLIAFMQLDALKYWDLGEYLESIRNMSRWIYDNSVYEDNQGNYKGFPYILPKAIICSIQSMDLNQISKEEKQNLITKIYNYYKIGFDNVIEFIIKNSCKCMWEYVIEWLKYFIIELDAKQLSRILKWLIEYDSFIKTQKHHFNLSEYDFLEQVVDRFSPTDWNNFIPIIERIYNNYNIYKINHDLGIKSLIHMPLSNCKRILKKIGSWSTDGTNSLKRDIVYEICITLSDKRGQEINIYLHQLIYRCQKLDPCEKYKELHKLIDIKNLLERNELDIDTIFQFLKKTLEKLNEIDVSKYNSTYFNKLEEKFINQNWRFASENQVLTIVDCLLDFLKNNDENLSSFYFYDICQLLNKISLTGTKNEKNRIINFYIKEYILTYRKKFKAPYYIDGPLSTVHLNFSGNGNREHGLSSILMYNITEIPMQYQKLCIIWVISHISKTNEMFYYATMLFSYYYFIGDEMIKNTAFSGLMYIRGYLESKENLNIGQLKNVLIALKNLNIADEWFGKLKFMQRIEQSTEYKEMFFNPLCFLKEKSYNSEIRHWKLEDSVNN